MYFGYGIVEVSGFEVAWLSSGPEEEPLCLIIEGGLGLLGVETEEEAAGTRESMRRYTEALCQMIKKTTIIPLRFGTMFEEEEQIKAILRQEAKSYRKLLGKLTNKIEVELKVWWKKESFEQTILKNKRLSRWKKSLQAGMSQGYEVVEFGKAIQEVADQERKALAKSFLSMLRPLAADWQVKDPVDEYQAFDGVFLVERSKEEEFDNTVGVLYDRNPEKFIFKYTGPWAPHHFIED